MTCPSVNQPPHVSAPASTPQASHQQPATVPQTLLNVIERLAGMGKFSPAAADDLRRLHSR